MYYPKLDIRFFNDFKIDEAWFHRQLSQNQEFNENMIPLYEWDGLIYILTSQAQSIKAKPNWRIVLSDSKNVKRLWKELQIPVSDVGDSWDEKTNIIHQPELLSPNQTEAPDLIDLKWASDSNQSPSPSSKDSYKDSLDLLDISSTNKNPTTLVKMSNPEPTMSQVKPKGVAYPTPPPPPPPQRSPLISSFNSSMANQNIRNAHSDNWPKFIEVVAKLRGVFDQFVYCKVSSEWVQVLDTTEDRYDKLQQEAELYELSAPSPFRIVNRSKQPYHGKIAPNPVMDRFFKKWEQGVMPIHLTIVPINSNEKLTGMFLAWSYKDLSDLKYLTQVLTAMGLSSFNKSESGSFAS